MYDILNIMTLRLLYRQRIVKEIIYFMIINIITEFYYHL